MIDSTLGDRLFCGEWGCEAAFLFDGVHNFSCVQKGGTQLKL